MWRLSQGDPASDTLRRSLSRSPTGDPPTETPSPAPSTSLRPMSAVVLRPKKSSPSTQSENQPLNLRRSGTYDLLNQDIDDTTDSVFDCQAKQHAKSCAFYVAFTCCDVKFSAGVATSLLLSLALYTGSKKTGPFSFEHNFGKYCPILIILSLLQTEIICPQTHN